MLLSNALALVLFLAFGFFDRAFFPALSGGPWPVDSVLALGILRMTSFASRGVALWMLCAAVTAEIFSEVGFSVAAAEMIVGLVSARLALYAIFSHKSIAARALCGIVGIVVAMLVRGSMQVAFGLLERSLVGVPQIGATAHAALAGAVWTSVFFCLLLFLLWFFERRLRRRS